MSDKVKKAIESLLGKDAPAPTPMPDGWWDIDEWLARHPHIRPEDIPLEDMTEGGKRWARRRLEREGENNARRTG